MIRRAVLAALIAFLIVLVPALPAQADDSAPYTRVDFQIEMLPNGVADVTMDFTMDFSQVSGRGPLMMFYTTQKDGQNPDEEYVFDFSDPEVTSRTGAPTDLSVDRGMHAVTWRIGDEDVVHYSPQDYTFDFTVKGMVAADHPESGLDEFNWQIFDNLASRFEDVSVTITGPVPVERAACFHGRGNTTPCESTVDNGTAYLAVDELPPGDGIQVVAGFPAGTFDVAPQAKRRVPTLSSNLSPGAVPTGIAGGLSVAALVGSVVASRRAKRDLVYLGLTPGTMPVAEDSASVGLKDTSKIPVAVQFQPPKGATPGEIGTLVDATADGIDVSATIIDLAVRGYIAIEPGRSKKDFTMHALGKPMDGLLAHEQHLLNKIFAGRSSRTMAELRDKNFHTVMSGARQRLYRQMVQNKWFVSNPQTAGLGKVLLGGFLALGGAIASMLLFERSLALLGLPFIILGIGLLIAGLQSKRRTARGSAMLQQSRGFELYLRTAEANQIKFEEGIDVFSRYLPYAMIFDVADRWSKVFDELEQQGRYQTDTRWLLADSGYSAFYYSSMMNNFADSFADSINASAASYAAAQASSASSGGSGFGGGGGFGGGSAGSW